MVTKLDELGMMTQEEKLSLLATLLETATAPEPSEESPDGVGSPDIVRPGAASDGNPLADLRFELLGPLVIRHGDVDVAPSAPKLRLILSTLLFNANKPVGASVLARELWSDGAPRTAHSTLQTYMFKLRRLFRDGARPVGRARHQRGAADLRRRLHPARRPAAARHHRVRPAGHRGLGRDARR